MLIVEGKMSSWSIREQSEKKEGSGRGVDRMRLFWSPSGPELWLSMAADTPRAINKMDPHLMMQGLQSYLLYTFRKSGLVPCSYKLFRYCTNNDGITID